MISAGTGTGAYWVAEANPRPFSKPALAGSVLRALSINALVVVTDQALKAAGPVTEAALRADLVTALSEVLDLYFLDPANAGLANTYPASITNGVTPIPATSDPAADLADLFSSFSGNWTRAFLICDPETGAQLSLARDASGSFLFVDAGPRGGTVCNIALLTSTACPRDSSGGTMVLVDAGAIAAAFGNVEVSESNATTLSMRDDPTSPTEQVSMFQTNSIAFKAVMAANWQLQHAAGVSVLTGVDYSAQSS